MKKGFTLIELLAILTLLGVIILVAVPSLVQSNKVAEDNSKTRFCETVKDACTSYAAINTTASSVTLNQLVDGNYLKQDLIIPGTTNKVSDNSIKNTSISLSNCNLNIAGVVSCS